MIERTLRAVAVLLAVSACFSTARASGENHPFSQGEKMVYVIKWVGIPVGEGALRVVSTGDLDGSTAYRFSLEVESYPAIDILYKVRDKFSSQAARDLSRSFLFTKLQKEGRTRRDVAVHFDWEKKEVVYSNFGEKKRPVALIPGALDPLAAVYFVRSRKLESMAELRVPVTDGKKCIVGVAKVRGKQTVDIGSGVYETFLLEANTENVGGMFEKTENKEFRVWITADERRIPVKLETSVSVGSVSAELISFFGGRRGED